MAFCQSRNHPQVPQTLCSVMISYCHSCMDWKVYVSGYVNYADDDQQVFFTEERGFGPFDDVGTVLAEADALMTEWMLSAGRPWDPEAPNPITGQPPRSALWWENPD